MTATGASRDAESGDPKPSPEAQRAAFTAWLAAKLGGAVEIAEWEAPEGAGHSNETILVTAKSASGEPLSLVVRVQAAEPAVFQRYDIGLQCACMERVAAHSKVPVPRVRWHESRRDVFGRPFYVMDRVDGLVPLDRIPYTLSGWLFEATADEQRMLYRASLDLLAEIHLIDWKKAGLDVVNQTAHGAPGLRQQMAWWMSFAKWVCQGRPQPVIDGAAAWLADHVPAPSGPVVLNWGDARISNIMYRDFRPVAVLDWEMAMLGPAEVDVGFFLFFQRFFSEGLGVPDLPGFPSRSDAIAAYEKRAGRRLDDLHFYEVFAAWRNSTIMLRIADLYESRGDLSPDSGAGQNNVATRMLAGMIGLPSPGEPGGPFG
jgi:aminoglycoside phosphotransferase (APT) family kinase protein